MIDDFSVISPKVAFEIADYDACFETQLTYIELFTFGTKVPGEFVLATKTNHSCSTIWKNISYRSNSGYANCRLCKQCFGQRCSRHKE